MLRVLWLSLVSSCVLGVSQAPEPAPTRNCTQLAHALKVTNQVLDAQSLKPIGLMVDPMLLAGIIDPELRLLLADSEEVEPYVGGDRLRPAARAVLGLLQLHPPRHLAEPAQALIRSSLEPPEDGDGLLGFMLSSSARLAVVNPLRKMLTDCGEGRPLAQAISDATGYQMSCGSTLACLLDEFAGLAGDPQIEQALQSLTLEGEEGRKAFGLLVAQIMRASSQPAFDVAQAQELLRRVFADRLPQASLERLDRLMTIIGQHFADEDRRSTWRKVVTCTDRHDPQFSVAGLFYDVVLGTELDLTQLLDSDDQDQASPALWIDPLHALAETIAQRPDLRLPLNAAVEPFLTVSMMRVVLTTLRSPDLRLAVEAWFDLIEKGPQCEPA